MSALHCWYCCQDHRPESCPNRTEAEKKADGLADGTGPETGS